MEVKLLFDGVSLFLITYEKGGQAQPHKCAGSRAGIAVHAIACFAPGPALQRFFAKRKKSVKQKFIL